jgi:hypothetical protein
MTFKSPLEEARDLANQVAAERTARAKEDAASSGDDGRRRRRVRLALLVGLAVVLGGVAGGRYLWDVGPGAPIPEAVLGTWTTTEPRYVDRAFELTASTVTFRSPGVALTYPIRHVRHEATERTHHLFIECDDAGTQITVALVYDSARGSLLFAHQPEVEWRRAPLQET